MKIEKQEIIILTYFLFWYFTPSKNWKKRSKHSIKQTVVTTVSTPTTFCKYNSPIAKYHIDFTKREKLLLES